MEIFRWFKIEWIYYVMWFSIHFDRYNPHKFVNEFKASLVVLFCFGILQIQCFYFHAIHILFICLVDIWHPSSLICIQWFVWPIDFFFLKTNYALLNDTLKKHKKIREKLNYSCNGFKIIMIRQIRQTFFVRKTTTKIEQTHSQVDHFSIDVAVIKVSTKIYKICSTNIRV